MPAVPIHEQKFIGEISGCPEKFITNSHVLSKPATAKQVLLFLKTKKLSRAQPEGLGGCFPFASLGSTQDIAPSGHKMNVSRVGEGTHQVTLTSATQDFFSYIKN